MYPNFCHGGLGNIRELPVFSKYLIFSPKENIIALQ